MLNAELPDWIGRQPGSLDEKEKIFAQTLHSFRALDVHFVHSTRCSFAKENESVAHDGHHASERRKKKFSRKNMKKKTLFGLND